MDEVLSEREERETREWAERHGYSKRAQDALVRYAAENIEARWRRVQEARAKEGRGAR